MYIIKKIFVKSTVSLFVGIASAIGTQIGLTLWNKYLNDIVEGNTEQLVKNRG